jgi:hypothetical protein
VTISALDAAREEQLPLFGAERRERSRRVDAAMDDILDRMGKGAIRRAAAPKHRKSSGGRRDAESHGDADDFG